MRLGDIYKSKTNQDIIQIDSFATPIGSTYEVVDGEMYIVVRHVFNNGGIYGSAPSFNSYGTQKEIEKRYELLVSADDLDNYEDWEEIFKLAGVE